MAGFGREGRNVARLGAVLLAALALTPAPARAGASAWTTTEQSQVRLISATSAVGGAESLKLGLHVRLEPGWKIYWRSPGDAGFPPVLDWTGSENLAAAEIHWPAPRRFTLFGLETFGYTDEVVFPLTVRPAQPAAGTSLRLALSYAICKDICIPFETSLVLALSGGEATATPFAPLIERYLARVPATANSSALALVSAVVRGPADAQVLEVGARSERPFRAPDLMVEGAEGFYFAAPTVELRAGGLEALLLVPVSAGKTPRLLAGQPLTLTLVDGERALERQMTPSAAE
jgi:suppressor for copper-sensitivity B